MQNTETTHHADFEYDFASTHEDEHLWFMTSPAK